MKLTPTGSLDYDLFVINPANQDTTPEQLRDCIYDALMRVDERLNIIESYLNKGELSTEKEESKNGE